MKTITFANLKGGVGKTTSCINLASLMASRGRRVLVIDADHQGNATMFFGVTPKDGDGTYALLHGDVSSYEKVVYPAADYRPGGKIDLIPGEMSLAYAGVSGLSDATYHGDSLRELAAEAAKADAYDLILIDCPPAFSAASVAAIAASDLVIIPVTLDAFSLRGADELLRQIESVRKLNPGLSCKLLVTMYHSGTREYFDRAALEDMGLPVFSTAIRNSVKVCGSILEGKALEVYSLRSAAAVDYRRLATELLKEWGETDV